MLPNTENNSCLHGDTTTITVREQAIMWRNSCFQLRPSTPPHHHHQHHNHHCYASACAARVAAHVHQRGSPPAFNTPPQSGGLFSISASAASGWRSSGATCVESCVSFCWAQLWFDMHGWAGTVRWDLSDMIYGNESFSNHCTPSVCRCTFEEECMRFDVRSTERWMGVRGN